MQLSIGLRCHTGIPMFAVLVDAVTLSHPATAGVKYVPMQEVCLAAFWLS